ncbi:SGNH hydrolase [Dacryopinax primogenitus]|uniref:SGNH hydrolase n=1 Tax=Dacryopinax primogenitus (strain DJM 731) TaxID=1858805 RepID=M5GAA7_DACPD|nr:SGNH hydrolase [Dacryopinax primogenitus]EJU05265.1 SGNH hydrolase [Dacryopinax primogenitus]
MSILPLTKSILLLGDSITQQGSQAGGYCQLLAESYIRKLAVVNRGYGGYNAKFLYEIVKQMVVEKSRKDFSEVALVTLFIGANDATDPVLNPRQHIPLPLYKEKVKAILGFFPPSTPKILITPPPVQPERFARFINADKPDRDIKVTKKYAEAIVEIGKELGLPVVDVFELFEKVPQEEWDSLFTDGLHLSSRAYKLVYDALTSVIKSKYSALDPEKMRMLFQMGIN